MAKEVVITIHGVNPDRSWQPAVHDVLRPHFEPIAHEYPDYDTIIGPVRAVSNIWLLSISAVVFLLFLDAVISGHWWKAVLAALAFVVMFPMSFVLGWHRRVACTKRLMRDISEKAPSGSPHVIAHSLGTYLVGRVIRKYTGVTFAKVLLVGSVLPRDFPWARIVKDRPRSVGSVRNEFGTSDSVVKTVGRIRWLVRDLGTAGHLGFQELAGVIHTSPSPVIRCPECSAIPVRVHNVPLRGYGHSEVFLGRRHAREIWLPFLWGFQADELNEYLEKLRVTAEFLRDRRWNEAERIINRLFSECFTWTHGMTLQDSVIDLVQARIRLGFQLAEGLSVEQVVSEVRLMLPVITADALAESVRPNPDENVASALHPNNAIAKVVDSAIKAREANGT